MSLVLCCNQFDLVIRSHILYCMDVHLSGIGCVFDTDTCGQYGDVEYQGEKRNRRGVGGCFYGLLGGLGSTELVG
jgi:hypothetical protein